jgi:branched-chain amino acid transport system ATP-binding protein
VNGVPLLAIDDLHVAYGHAPVLNGISLTLNSGDSLAILGRNGAGKTTLIRALMGLLPVGSGTISLDSRPITDLPAYRRAPLGLGYVPQGRKLFTRLTVQQNLIVGAKSAPADGATTLDHVYAMFPKLAERRRQAAGSLSGGEQQMLAVARALMSSPRLLLLDEPSEGLAPIVIESMIDDIVTAAEKLGFAFIVVEQNVEAALRAAARAVVLDQGRITMSSDSEHMRHDPALIEALSV